ncbi:MAG: translation elongation factor Ts [Saprospiraceae bacterium]|nr:translation elongation factor Ts [Saprospiraceae bacterium]
MSEVKISAKDVKTLRDQTGAGMMDCKKALIEAGGDFEAAIDILRKKGQKLSLKRAEREAKEGVAIALLSDDNSKGVALKLSCETDFVAKNQDFVDLTTSIAKVALEKFPENLDDLLNEDFGGISIGEKVVEQIGVIGEKLELADYHRMEAPQVASYIHMGNKAAVLVGLSVADADLHDAGRDVAMQVAAMKPVAVDKDGVSQDLINKEIEIGKEQARAEGKPEAIIEKIAMGKLGKFFKENTLLNQAFVKDSKQTVSQYLKSKHPDLTVTAFKHVKLG